jgi:hypothetical protein
MDEYSRGMDPEVKRYFKRIINSFSVACFWLLSVSTAGLFFKLAIVRDGMRWYNILYYVLASVSLVWLLVYLYKVWNRKL